MSGDLRTPASWWPFILLCAGMGAVAVGVVLGLFGLWHVGAVVLGGTWAGFWLWGRTGPASRGRSAGRSRRTKGS